MTNKNENSAAEAKFTTESYVIYDKCAELVIGIDGNPDGFSYRFGEDYLELIDKNKIKPSRRLMIEPHIMQRIKRNGNVLIVYFKDDSPVGEALIDLDGKEIAED